MGPLKASVLSQWARGGEGRKVRGTEGKEELDLATSGVFIGRLDFAPKILQKYHQTADDLKKGSDRRTREIVECQKCHLLEEVTRPWIRSMLTKSIRNWIDWGDSPPGGKRGEGVLGQSCK